LACSLGIKPHNLKSYAGLLAQLFIYNFFLLDDLSHNTRTHSTTTFTNGEA
jgi:hypothetical protein